MPLTGKQRRFLRSRGHHLAPIAQVGKEGMTPAFVQGVAEALLAHELVKIRVGNNAMLDRKETAAALAEATSSEVAQVLGNTLLLYRRHPEEPTLELP